MSPARFADNSGADYLDLEDPPKPEFHFGVPEYTIIVAYTITIVYLHWRWRRSVVSFCGTIVYYEWHLVYTFLLLAEHALYLLLCLLSYEVRPLP